jgi:aldose 1-epimerase
LALCPGDFLLAWLNFVKHKLFGNMPDGTPVELFSFGSEGLEVELISYGAGIMSLCAPDRHGRFEDVVLGFPDLASLVRDHSSKAPHFFGSTIGRYANRIAQGQFALDGRNIQLSKISGEHSLHGGAGGFYNRVWRAETVENGVAFHYFSKDGEEGFPGNLDTTVRFTLSGADLRIDYQAATDKPTVVNLTNHSYFNLAGRGGSSILSHQLRLFASRFTSVDAGMIPTGELRAVAGTPFDFRKAHSIGEHIAATEEQIRLGHGYDHNFVLDGDSSIKQAAELYDPASGRVLEIWTTEPGIQFYSGNYLDGKVRGKYGTVYAKYAGLCLETQHFPDSPNYQEFPTVILRPGESFHSTTILRFGAR